MITGHDVQNIVSIKKDLCFHRSVFFEKRRRSFSRIFWGSRGPNGGLDGVGGGSPSAHQPPDPILTPFGTPLPPENARKHDRLLAFLKVNTSMTTKINIHLYISYIEIAKEVG